MTSPITSVASVETAWVDAGKSCTAPQLAWRDHGPRRTGPWTDSIKEIGGLLLRRPRETDARRPFAYIRVITDGTNPEGLKGGPCSSRRRIYTEEIRKGQTGNQTTVRSLPRRFRFVKVRLTGSTDRAIYWARDSLLR